MTALWHEQQREIRSGETTLEAFLEGVAGHIGQEVARAGTAEIRVAATGPACPACTKGVMKRRKGSKGEFMGCSRYPDCRHTADAPGGAPDAAKRAGKSAKRATKKVAKKASTTGGRTTGSTTKRAGTKRRAAGTRPGPDGTPPGGGP